MTATAAQKKTAFKNQAKKHAKTWQESRKAKPGEGFAVPEIEPGRYLMTITGDYEIGEKGKLKGHSICRIYGTTTEKSDGADEGVQVSQMYDFDSDRFDGMAAVARDLKRLMPEKEEEIESFDNPGEVADLIDELNANPVSCWVTVEDYIKKGDTSGKVSGKNIRFDELADGDGGSGDVQVEEDVQVEDEGDGPEWEPAKGEKVTFQNRGKSIAGTILTVNRADNTARVKADKDGRTYGPLTWDKLELAE